MPASPAFDTALTFVLQREGEYSDDANDHGGRTMRGVTQATYDAWRAATHQPPRPVAEISDDEVRRIYYGYWLDAGCDVLEQLGRPQLALVHMDCAVNCGGGRARRLLQRALGLAEDGAWGPVTREAIARADEGAAVDAYLAVRAAFYRELATGPGQAGFLNSWMSRLRYAAKATERPISVAFAHTAENGAPDSVA